MKKIFFLFSITVILSCSKEEVKLNESALSTISEGFVVWSGPTIEFVKESGANPLETINQDQIAPSVSITRGNDGGQIYNIILENKSEKDFSPLGTQWAIGDTSNLYNLTFGPFRTIVGRPQEVVGKKLVLHIMQENIYLSVEFTSWFQGQNGGFSYKRSTQN